MNTMESLTDAILFVETSIFALLLWRSSPRSPTQTLAALLFVCLAASSLFGALYHGFFPEGIESAIGWIFWQLTMLSAGAAATFIGMIDGVYLRISVRKMVPWALCLFAGYLFVLLFVSLRFWVSIVYAVPPLLTLLGIFVWHALRDRSRKAAIGATAILLTFLASALQQLQIGLDPMLFNHNALYHALQAVVFYLLFRVFRTLR